MLEAGENPALCRNGKKYLYASKSDTAVIKVSRARSSGLLMAHTSACEQVRGKMPVSAIDRQDVRQPRELTPERARYDNLTTWLAETLDGPMFVPIELQFDGHEVYGHDGTPLKQVFGKGLTEAESIVRTGPNLLFELRRRRLELGEYNDMLALAKGDASNTLIVVSDFPAELMDAKADVGGYNVTRKQTMLRVITKASDGTLKIRTQSLDGSDRAGLEAVYGAMGQRPLPVELLGQRMQCDLADADQALIIEHLMGAYDRSMASQYGGQWYAGRPGVKPETYNFVCRQVDLLQSFLGQSSHTEADMYNLAAACRARFEAGMTPMVNILRANFDPSRIQNELMQAGSNARAEGKVFSACGSTLGDRATTTQGLEDAGYGNKTKAGENYSFDKKMHCVVCQKPPKKGESKKPCGPCGICKGCDSKFKKTGKF